MCPLSGSRSYGVMVVVGLTLAFALPSLAGAQGNLPTAVYGARGPQVLVNGQVLAAPAREISDHTFLPMRALFDALQANVTWTAASQEITATRGNDIVKMWIGRNVALVNGHQITLSAPPLLLGEETYVPLRFPAETFGGDVRWNAELQLATVNLGATSSAPPLAVIPPPAPPAAPPVVLTPPAPVPALVPAYVPGRSGANGVHVELSRPQSDDEGHYLNVLAEEASTVFGAVAAPRGVTQVTVNGVPAALSPATTRVLGAPAGMAALSFMAPVDLEPTSVLYVTVLDSLGLQTTIAFLPDRDATLARLAYLRDVTQAAIARHELVETDLAWWDFRLANAYVFDRRYDLALPLYRRFVTVEAGVAIGPFFLGLALYEDHQYDLALAEYQRVTVLAPGFYFAHYEMGRCHEARHRYDDAILEYRQVTVERPDCLAARWRLGQTLALAGRHDEAVLQLRTVVTSAPRFAAGHRDLGLALAAQNNWPAAAEEYSRAVRLNPGNPALHTHFGDALSHQQQYDRAIQQYDQALRGNPRQPEAHQGVVRTMVNAGQYGQAWQRVHEAQRLGVGLPTPLLQQLRQRQPEPRGQVTPGGPSPGHGPGGSRWHGGRH